MAAADAGRSGRLAGFIGTLLVIAYPLLSHASVLLKAPHLQFAALLSFAAVPLLPRLLRGAWGAWALFLGLALGFWALALHGAAQYALYLPPLVISGALAVSFGLSLQAGRTPLITLFARIVRGGELPEELRCYTRKLTLFWAWLVAALFVLTLVLSFTGPLWLWSLHTNLFSYLVLSVVFVVEFFLRRVWFPQHHHLDFWPYLKRMTKIRGGQLR
jgi:uncharacterized membrane protein